MGRRDTLISKSILRAIFHDNKDDKKSLLTRILAFFSFFQLQLARFKHVLFKELRTEAWEMDEDEYRESFRSQDKRGKLKPVGDLGYSGSTFFTTPNSKFLIKSIPRRFEYTFFSNDMLPIYYEHMTSHPKSLLVRITDFLYTPHATIGGLIGLAPTHHVVMENILYGKEEDEKKDEWETYDLKPNSYFYPERDIAGGRLAPESVKKKLVDKFEDKIRIGLDEREELLALLQQDTKALQDANAVDYSLFLVRYPSPSGLDCDIPSLRSRTTPWRTGVTSTDGKWVYRAVILDFFWAKHKTRAKAMTALVESYNVVGRQGPMSITTTPEEYRNRFLKMVEEIVEVGAE